MITKESVRLEMQGEAFSPAAAQRATGLVFVHAVEPGEQGRTGRYKGLPTPHGAASLIVPDHTPGGARLSWLLDAVLPHIATLRVLGAIRIEVWAVYGWQDQCGLEYGPEELAKLARLGVPFCVDCYEDVASPHAVHGSVHVTVHAGEHLLGHADVRGLDVSMGGYGGPLQPTAELERVRSVIDHLSSVMLAWPSDDDALHEAYAARDALALRVEAAGSSLDVLTVHIEHDETGYTLQLLGWAWQDAQGFFEAPVT